MEKYDNRVNKDLVIMIREGAEREKEKGRRVILVFIL